MFALHQSMAQKPIQYVTLHFWDRCDAPSLYYRNHAKITVLECNRSPIGVCFSWQLSLNIAYSPTEVNLHGNERQCTYEAPVPLLPSCTLMLLLATIVVGWCEWFMWLPGLGIPLCCDVTMSTASVMARWIILLELAACCCWWSLSCSLRRWQNQQEEIRPFGL